MVHLRAFSKAVACAGTLYFLEGATLKQQLPLEVAKKHVESGRQSTQPRQQSTSKPFKPIPLVTGELPAPKSWGTSPTSWIQSHGSCCGEIIAAHPGGFRTHLKYKFWHWHSMWAPVKILYISVLWKCWSLLRTISMSSVLCQCRFWRGSYRFTVFRVHLTHMIVFTYALSHGIHDDLFSWLYECVYTYIIVIYKYIYIWYNYRLCIVNSDLYVIYLCVNLSASSSCFPPWLPSCIVLWKLMGCSGRRLTSLGAAREPQLQPLKSRCGSSWSFNGHWNIKPSTQTPGEN